MGHTSSGTRTTVWKPGHYDVERPQGHGNTWSAGKCVSRKNRLHQHSHRWFLLLWHSNNYRHPHLGVARHYRQPELRAGTVHSWLYINIDLCILIKFAWWKNLQNYLLIKKRRGRGIQWVDDCHCHLSFSLSLSTSRWFWWRRNVFQRLWFLVFLHRKILLYVPVHPHRKTLSWYTHTSKTQEIYVLIHPHRQDPFFCFYW